MIKCDNFRSKMKQVTTDIINVLISCDEEFYIKIFASKSNWKPSVPIDLISSEEVQNSGLTIQVKSNQNIKFVKDHFLVSIVKDNKSYIKEIYADEIISVLDSDKVVIVFNNYERSLVSEGSDIDEIAELISINEEINEKEIKHSLTSILNKIKDIK